MPPGQSVKLMNYPKAKVAGWKSGAPIQDGDSGGKEIANRPDQSSLGHEGQA